jgi:TATA-box binding protein (TBP) (component of TFIID and TFIIIB)
MDPIVSVKNVVCTFQLGFNLNSAPLAQALHARFDFKWFPAFVSRMKETLATNSIFTTGSVVIVGCQTKQHGQLSAWLLVEKLQREMHVDSCVYNFQVRNLVCRVKLPFYVNIELFFRDHGPLISTYKPELFPGLLWKTKIDNLEVTLTLFFQGSGVATGLKVNEQIPAVSAMLLRELQRYRLGHEYRKFTSDERTLIGTKRLDKINEFYRLSIGEVVDDAKAKMKKRKREEDEAAS